MSDWMELLHLPPGQSDLIVFACVALFFTRFKDHFKLYQSAFAALVVFLLISSALPHLNDNGLFSVHDFGESLLSASLGLLVSRYAALFVLISALRQVSKRYLPKKLFFKN